MLTLHTIGTTEYDWHWLMDEKEGYGDDFDFDKHYMINTIMPEHLQVLDLDMNPCSVSQF